MRGTAPKKCGTEQAMTTMVGWDARQKNRRSERERERGLETRERTPFRAALLRNFSVRHFSRRAAAYWMPRRGYPLNNRMLSGSLHFHSNSLEFLILF